MAGRERCPLADRAALPQVLWFWLSSDNPWVCKRALQVCAQLLEDCRDGVAFQVRKDAHRVPPAPSPATCKGAWQGSSARLCTGCRVPQRSAMGWPLCLVLA